MLLHLHIIARSPLAFAQSKPGTQFRQSHPYVPGAAIYGALGGLLGEQNVFDADLFAQVRCHNAYPAQPADEWVRPVPATALQPKGAEHVPQDTLVPLVCWEQQQPAALIYVPTDVEGRAWDASDWHFYTQDEHKHLHKRSVTQRVLTRVAINRRRGTAEDGRLYSPLVLTEAARDRVTDDFVDTQFRGSLLLPDNAEAMRNAIGHLSRLGGRQSTGLGAVEVTSAIRQPETATDVQRRVQQLTTQFQKQTQRYADPRMRGASWRIADETIFTVNLLSDAILLEDGWVPTSELSANALKSLTGIDATLVRSFATTSTVGGWNVTWQRPKPTTLATTMGSLFVFQATTSLTPDQYARLAALQYDGIGERRQEGYGQIRICDEFHLMKEAA